MRPRCDRQRRRPTIEAGSNPECLDVAGAHDRELAAVERRQLRLVQPFHDGEHRGIGESHAQVDVAPSPPARANRRRGAVGDPVFAERVYAMLSLVAKSALAWQAYAGALAGF
jgi:hypothetical protein